MLALYGFDIWDAIDGRVPVRRALQLLGRLSFEPRSIWRAKQHGGPELQDYARFIGWDSNSDILADLVDAVNLNSKLLIDSNSTEPSPDVPMYPRPGAEPIETKPTETLENFGNKLINLFGPGIVGG